MQSCGLGVTHRQVIYNAQHAAGSVSDLHWSLLTVLRGYKGAADGGLNLTVRFFNPRDKHMCKSVHVSESRRHFSCLFSVLLVSRVSLWLFHE